jgi:hypothetical protein
MGNRERGRERVCYGRWTFLGDGACNICLSLACRTMIKDEKVETIRCNECELCASLLVVCRRNTGESREVGCVL